MNDFTEFGTGLNVPANSGDEDAPTVHPEQVMGFSVTFSGERARELWKRYREGCSVSDLKTVAEGLYRAREAVWGKIQSAAENGEGVPQDLKDKYQQALFEAPLVEVMYERAVFNRGTIPRWDEIRWQDRVQMLLSVDDAPVKALRCLYFLLVQRDRDFDDHKDLYAAAGDILGIQRRSVERSLRRGIDGETPGSYLEDLRELLGSVPEWREWLDGKKGLRVDVAVSQENL